MVSRAVSCYRLSLNINVNAGLEFNSEFVLVDGDLFNQPPDKLFIEFSSIVYYFLGLKILVDPLNGDLLKITENPLTCSHKQIL